MKTPNKTINSILSVLSIISFHFSIVLFKAKTDPKMLSIKNRNCLSGLLCLPQERLSIEKYTCSPETWLGPEPPNEREEKISSNPCGFKKILSMSVWKSSWLIVTLKNVPFNLIPTIQPKIRLYLKMIKIFSIIEFKICSLRSKRRLFTRKR